MDRLHETTFGCATWMAALTAALLLAASCVPTDSGPPPDVTGRWTGQCSDCPVRAFHLVLKQDGEQLTGSLRPVGRSGLGESELPLRNGKIAGRAVSFRVDGADGVAMDADLRVGADGRTMTGQGRHRAMFGLSFSRASP